MFQLNRNRFHGPRRLQGSMPLSRAELHIHLDGSVRLSTVWELSRQKGLPLPGRGTVEDLQSAVQLAESATLATFLAGFRHTAPALTGDTAAMERVGYEFCQDAAANGLLYVESRFCPHLLVDPNGAQDSATADDIIEAVHRGYARGEKEFGVTVRTILCCIRGLSQFDHDILRLCEKYRGLGVVGIDVAGDEGELDYTKELAYARDMVEIYDEARRLGVARTAHAGEVGPAESVRQALDVMHADRIGHGYHVLDDPGLYTRCLKDRVHFETCPTSSILTGAQPPSVFRHAIVRFAEDGANYSLNTDDPMVTGTWTQQEYEVVASWGLTEAHLVRANVNAVRSCFLPPAEKKDMLKKLYSAHGIVMDEV